MILLLSYSCFEGQQEAFPHQQWASVESNEAGASSSEAVRMGVDLLSCFICGKSLYGSRGLLLWAAGEGHNWEVKWTTLFESLRSISSRMLPCTASSWWEKKKKHISIERDNLVLFKSISEVCKPTSLSDCPVHWTQHLHSSVFSFCCNLLLLLLAAALTTEITAKKINK